MKYDVELEGQFRYRIEVDASNKKEAIDKATEELNKCISYTEIYDKTVKEIK